MLTIYKRIFINSSHRLPNHQGKCKNIHGHTWEIVIGITGEINSDPASPELGMIMDFSELKELLTEVFEKYDHTSLNAYCHTPTAEALTHLFRGELEQLLSQRTPPVLLTHVTVKESRDSWATWEGNNEIYE